MGRYLLDAMKKVLGNAFTPDIRDAWAAAYNQLADLMINREAQLYQEADGWTDWRDFCISKKIQESSEIASFYLTPRDQKPLPSYLPGQYVSVRLPVPDLQCLQTRQYSLSDAHQPDHYRISVKKESALDLEHPNAVNHPGYISNILHDDLKVGNLVQVSHPAGEFFFDTHREASSERPVVLISAGVGLTPDLSIFNTLIKENSKRKLSWVHATRNSRVQAFKEHVEETAKAHGNVQAHVFNKEPAADDKQGVDYEFKGRMSLNKLDTDHDLFINDATAEYYVCGPEQFMVDMENELKGWGIGPKRIKLEVFGTGEIPTA